MANTQRANPADRFRIPASVSKWHLTRRIVRGRFYRPDGAETADTLPQAFRLEVPKYQAGDKPRGPGGKQAS